jgi:hypothetical protein
MANRLESIDAEHASTVALMHGPLLLFPLNAASPAVTRQQLLSAKNVGPQIWQAETNNGPLKLLPFTAIEDEPYSTYLTVR